MKRKRHLRGWRRVRDHPSATVLVITSVVLAALLIPSLVELRAPGNIQDEGLLLVYPTRMLAGAVPNKSFVSVYGAGSLLTLEAIYRVVGASVRAERIVGLAYHLTMVGALMTLAWRKRGGASALLAGLIAVAFVVPVGLSANAWSGALALGALAMLLLDIALHRADDSAEFFWAGLCLGLVGSFRTDLGTVALLVVAIIVVARRSAMRLVIPGVAVGLMPLVWNLWTAGPSAVIRDQVFQPLVVSGPGRQLPLTGLSVPALVLLALSAATACAWVLMGIWHPSKKWTGPRTAALCLGAFEIALLPATVDRATTTHLCSVWMFIFPTAVMLRFGEAGGHRFVSWQLPAALIILVLASVSTIGPTYKTQLVQEMGNRPDPQWSVTNDGRSWPVSSSSQAAELTALLKTVDSDFPPGARVFVGPRDLRRTNYTDTFLYFLLPRLTPGTYFLEMDPGVASAPGSRLASDVRGSDLLILDHQLDGWNEPNASRNFGSDAPNRIVTSEFAAVGHWGPWELLRHVPTTAQAAARRSAASSAPAGDHSPPAERR